MGYRQMCGIGECLEFLHLKGMCRAHYDAWRQQVKAEGRDPEREPSGVQGKVVRRRHERRTRNHGLPVSAGPQELEPDDWRRAVYGGVQIIGVERKRRPPKTVADRIRAAQHGACLYCEIPIGAQIWRGNELVTLIANWDHFVPYAYAQRSRGNWVLACHICNAIKSTRMFDTIQQARLVILPRRERKGYESPLSALARMLGGAPARTGPQEAPGVTRQGNTGGATPEGRSVAPGAVGGASSGFPDAAGTAVGRPEAPGADARPGATP